MKRPYLIFLVFMLIFVTLTGCSGQSPANKETAGENTKTSVDQSTAETKESTEPSISQSTAAAQETTKPDVDQSTIVYTNDQYNFSFTLPGGWKGYKIINDKWEGISLEGDAGQKVVVSGPMLSIRHPQWTSQNPRQDIPIMIFTLEQWNSLQQDKFHIGAAPVNPSELGRNSKYVFALPARYNFAFPTGFEEVEKILNGKPLKAQ